ncbi:MAG: SusC/RagA family TonB-linked outer membrane protein [Marinoscillum sp.]|uniref:SusC/RagA family TonB-linked outer membrane protein n=1 Tax=Marinoscillum sp. TaxID=2024838 RepID=UPI0032FBE847
MKNNLLREILTMSKLLFQVLFLQVIFATFLYAEETSAQNKSVYEIKVSIHAKDVSVIEVFKQLEEKTDFLFTYNDENIDANKVTLNRRNKSVGEILEDLSGLTDLRFKRINDNIHVNRSQARNVSVEENYLTRQEFTVSGTVTDEDGAELPGVTVLIKGTATGTVTDLNGEYKLAVSDADALVFSSVGFLTQEVAINGRTTIDVAMNYDVQSLAEVVVTGYTSQRKADITGAVTVVDAEALNAIKAPSFSQKLAGRATGVTVSNSGSPGGGTNIRIRGISSFGSSDPLIIVDGVQIQGDKAMNGLNPNDIESMQILKDASASSIYGSRANAGVIIITTKQGKPGKIKVTYDGYAGVQNPVGGYNDILIKDPVDYARIQIAKNPALTNYYGGDPNNPVIPDYFFPVATSDNGTPDNADDDFLIPANPNEASYSFPDNLIMRSNKDGTDWWDAVFDPALITEHHFGISGGSENATFSSSVGYLKQDGTMINTGFERLSARLNSRVNAGKFTFGESLSVAHSSTVDQQGGNQNEQNTVTQTLLMNTIVPVYDIAGNYAGGKTNGFSNGKNPVAFAENNRHDVGTDFRVLTNIFGEYELIEGLKFRSSFSVDFRQNFQPSANFPRYEDREVNSSNSYQETHQSYLNWVWTNTLEYSKKFGDDHSLKLLAGQEGVKNQFKQINGQVNDLAFIDPNVRFLNLSYSTFSSIGSQERVVALASVFGQVDYSYKDKYLISGVVRRDGTSEFIGDNRYGVFPAVSVGWRVSEESFMNSISFIDDLKIRGGWGITGNQNIPVAYNAYNRYGGRSPSDAGYDLGGTGGSMTPGFTLYRYGNPNTKWEENESMNVGLDASLIDGKVSVVFDVYQRDINDLIFDPTNPGSAGNSQASFRNVASMRNTGWDLGLGYRERFSGDLGFNAFLNLSHYKNEIIKLDGEASAIFPAGIDKRFGEVNIWQVGSPISSFYGYTNDGFFQDAADVAALDQAGAAIGRFRRKDLNNDGVINGDDQGVIGNPHPDITMGLNLGLDFKGFDFSVMLFASIGNDIYNYNKLFTHFGQFNSNMSKDVLTDTWTENNRNASLPKLDGGDTFASQSSDFYVEDGSYLRAQNITLGYTIPTANISSISSLRVYVQAQNAFTITGYSGIDPALSNANIGTAVDGRLQNDGWTGYDLGNYPASKIFMIGVNAAF